MVWTQKEHKSLEPSPIMIKLNVGNELGLHARVAARIAATVQQFDSQVLLCKDKTKAEGDSVLSILTLDAPQGSTLTASASGPQAREALQALEKLFSSNFGEM
jgi:phosphocarrier protein